METSTAFISGQTARRTSYSDDPLTAQSVHEGIISISKKILSNNNLTPTQRKYIEECSEVSKNFLKLNSETPVKIPNEQLQFLENFLCSKNYEGALMYANKLLQCRLTESETLFVHQARKRALGHRVIESVTAHVRNGNIEFALLILEQFLEEYPDCQSAKEYHQYLSSMTA